MLSWSSYLTLLTRILKSDSMLMRRGSRGSYSESFIIRTELKLRKLLIEVKFVKQETLGKKI